MHLSVPLLQSPSQPLHRGLWGVRPDEGDHVVQPQPHRRLRKRLVVQNSRTKQDSQGLRGLPPAKVLQDQHKAAL